MCGLVGVFGNIFENSRKYFNDALQANVIRGDDSVGVFALRDTHKGTIIKEADLPQFLLWSKTWKEELKQHKHILLMGHNRAATVGNVDAQSAHPFNHKHIIMAHNGTLINWKDLYTKDNLPDHWTDSQVLCWSIANRGIKDTWKELEGAATITYYDKNKRCLVIASNGKRPFFVAKNKHTPTLYWASERWMLEGIAQRNNIQLEATTTPSANKMYQIFLEKDKLTICMEDLPYVPEIKKNTYSHGYNEIDWYNKKDNLKVYEYHNAPYGSGKGVVPRSGWAKDIMSKHLFEVSYKTCGFCRNPIHNEYESTYIVEGVPACLPCNGEDS